MSIIQRCILRGALRRRNSRQIPPPTDTTIWISTARNDNNTNNTSCKSPTEESLQQTEAAITYNTNDDADDGSNVIHRMYEYKRSPSMELLFDCHDSGTNHGEDVADTAASTAAITTTAAAGEEQGVAVVYSSIMICPTSKIQSSLIRSNHVKWRERDALSSIYLHATDVQ